MMGSNVKPIEARPATRAGTRAAGPAMEATVPGDKKISFGVETFCDVQNWGLDNLLESPDMNLLQSEYDRVDNLLFGDSSEHREIEKCGAGGTFATDSGSGNGQEATVDSLEGVPINKYLTSIFDITKDSRPSGKNSKQEMLKKYHTYADKAADIFLPFESDDLFFKNGPGVDYITYDKLSMSMGGDEFDKCPALTCLQMKNDQQGQVEKLALGQETEHDDARTVHYHDMTNSASTTSSAQGVGYPGIRKTKTDFHNFDTKKRQDQLLNIYRSFNTPPADMKYDFHDSLFGLSMNTQNVFGSDLLSGTANFGDRTRSPLFHPLAYDSSDPLADTLTGSVDHDKEATTESLHPSDHGNSMRMSSQIKDEMNAAEYNLYKNLMNYLDTQQPEECATGLMSGKDDLIDLQNTVLYEGNGNGNLDTFQDGHFMNADTLTNGVGPAGVGPGEYYPMKGSVSATQTYLGTPAREPTDPTNNRVKASHILKNCIVSLIQNGEDDIMLYESLVNAISDHHRHKNGHGHVGRYVPPGSVDKMAATNLKPAHYATSANNANIYRVGAESDVHVRSYMPAEEQHMRQPKRDTTDLYMSLHEDRTRRKETESKGAGERPDYLRSVQTSGSKQPVVNILFDEYYSKFLPKREEGNVRSPMTEHLKYLKSQENKGLSAFAYGKKKSETERRGTTFGRKKDTIDDMLFSNIRNKKDSAYPLGMSEVQKKTEDTTLYTQDRFVNGQFVPRKRSGGTTNQLNFNIGTRGMAEVRTRNKNLGSFYSPDVNRISAMHNGNLNKGPTEGDIKSHINGTYDKMDMYRDTMMRSRTPGYTSKPWVNNSLHKGMSYNVREGTMNPSPLLTRGQYKSDIVRTQPFNKYKAIDSDNIKYTPEQLKSLITTTDEKNMDLLLQSLYDDRILPLEFNLNGRLEEMKILSFLKNNWLVAYGLYPDKYVIKKTKDLSDNLIFFKNRKVDEDYFVYLNNLEDKYDKEMWIQFEKYLKTIAESEDPSMYEFAGGRYGMAKELKRRNLPFFKGLYLGHICHIIHLSTNRKLIAYEQKLLKPISKCHKFMNAKLGILNSSESDSNTYIASVEELRFYMNELLKYYRGGFNISTLKKKLKTKFNKQISESIFHCIKLIDVLQLPDLEDICIVDKEMKYVRTAKKL